jgi:hypothetical protein
MNSSEKFSNRFINLIFLLSYITILIGLFYGEDSLGGAKGDYIYHLNISNNFNTNFIETWKGFGFGEDGLQTRNSPVFWIIISVINKFLSHDFIRLINTSVSLIISIFFFKCLCLKFKKIDRKLLAIIACSVIFLSPTIRSLSIWPYSLIWGLFLFIISIYNYLLFKEKKIIKDKTINSFFCIFYLAIASYLYPSFAVFSIYYVFYFFKFFGFTKNFMIIMLTNFIVAMPALYFILTKGLYFFHATGITLSNSVHFNLSSKFIIISSLILYFLIPILDFKEAYIEIKKKIRIKESFFLIFITIIFINFFSYPYFEGGGFGGGFFHKISNIILNNNLILYLCFYVFLNIYIYLFKNNLNNHLIYLTLILFNLQFTIYNKYFDPLLLILIFLIFDFNLDKHLLKNKKQIAKFVFILFIYLSMGLFKNKFYLLV